MKEPLESYNENLKSNWGKSATKLFKTKYIDHIIEENIFSLNENEFLKGDIKKIQPGKIYTYQYDPKYKDRLDYYDTRPIVFVEKVLYFPNTGNIVIQGLNFSFLPPQFRVAILSTFYKLFKGEIEKNESEMWGEKYSIIAKMFFFFKQWLKTKKVFEQVHGLHFGFAHRRYIITRIKNLMVVDYDDWEIIPFINSKEIVGASVNDIYKDYYEKLKNKDGRIYKPKQKK